MANVTDDVLQQLLNTTNISATLDSEEAGSGSGESGSGDVELLTITLPYLIPMIFCIVLVCIALGRVGWSPGNLEGLLAHSSRIGDKAYARGVPLAMFCFRLFCLVPLLLLALLGIAIY